MSFILDCSITMTWCFYDEATTHTDALLESLNNSCAWVPIIWPLEVANVLWASERSNKIKQADAVQFKLLLMKLPIQLDETTTRQIFENIADIARAQDITIYDASYLELAIRKGLALATLDKQLIKAAKRVGVTII